MLGVIVERRAHDLSPDAEVGSAVLPGLNADAVVRAALGWESDGRFLPFVIASDLVPGRFRAEVERGELPSLRAIKSRMHVGTDRARVIRDQLGQALESGAVADAA